jgi:hypothetical protein
MKSCFSLVALAVISAVLSASSSLATVQPTNFTYQGQLKRGVSPYTGTCDFNVAMYDTRDSVSGQIGAWAALDVPVTGGLFALPLNFGVNPFFGDARWLFLQVRCGTDIGFTDLTPRVAITSTPYAVGLAPGASINGDAATLGRDLLSVDNSATSGFSNAIHGNSHSANGSGVWGSSDAANGAGVSGSNSVGPGVLGSNPAGIGVSGTGYSGVYGTGHNGVFGSTSLAAGFGVYGENTSNVGVAIEGHGLAGIGVEGRGTTAGVNGIGSPGVKGTGSIAGVHGVYGLATGAGSGVLGENDDLVNGYGGTFFGNVSIQGGGALNVGATGTKIKRILAGTATVGSNGTGSVTFTVNFAAFSGVPHALAIARNDPLNNNVADTFVVSIREIKTNLVTFNIIRIDANAGWAQNLQLDWMAWE